MTIRLRSSVYFASLENGAVLLDERANSYYQLNPTGALVLHALLRTGLPADAAERLRMRYAVETDEALRDVHDFLAELRAAHLVEP